MLTIFVFHVTLGKVTIFLRIERPRSCRFAWHSIRVNTVFHWVTSGLAHILTFHLDCSPWTSQRLDFWCIADVHLSVVTLTFCLSVWRAYLCEYITDWCVQWFKRYVLSELDLSNNKTDKDDLWVDRKPICPQGYLSQVGRFRSIVDYRKSSNSSPSMCWLYRELLDNLWYI